MNETKEKETKEKENKGCAICMMIAALIVVIYVVIFELVPRILTGY